MTGRGGADLQFSLYLPRLLLGWQSQPNAGDVLDVDGTLVFADVSGFTRLSEELAQQGRIGSEQVTEVLNGAFAELLDVAALDGGDLLKFGGDALLLFFSGPEHAARAARSAFDMRDALKDFQERSSPVPLAMSMGVATGQLHAVLAGGESREMLVTGLVASEVAEMENAASAGEILLAPATVAAIGDPSIVGERIGRGSLLEDAPDPDDFEPPEDESGAMEFVRFIPARLRKHLTVSFNEGEHRMANVAFVALCGLDAVMAEEGSDAAARMLDDVVRQVQAAADRFGVALLASDIAADGAKLILATGVPERSDADEERILRAAREIGSINAGLAVSVGAARGPVFAGDLGSRMRRVYTVIGDTVNLAARLAAAAGPGGVLVTEEVLERAASVFEATHLDPIALKGKAEPVSPVSVGAVLASGATQAGGAYALMGRDEALARLLAELGEAESGVGGEVVDLGGVAGIGKTRLLEAFVEACGLRPIVATGEAYESSTAYHVAGQIVRSALDLPADGSSAELGVQLVSVVTERCPAFLPWLPLVARVVGASVDPTPEVEAIDDQFQAHRTDDAIEQVLTAVLDEPTVVVVDGAEWADEASRRTILRMMAVVADRPWVVCLSRRPGPGWSDLQPGTRIELEPLALDAARRLLALALAEVELPSWRFDAILERAAGNPFFLLELASSVRDGEEELPESIEAVAAERIDHLDLRDRRLLRYAAVLGQRFTVDLLADALPDAAPVLEDTGVWDRLAEFLDVSATGTVRFRQPILRDVAYAGLPYGRRAELHRAVGEALERRARRRPERFAELLSLHFDRAEDNARAWKYSTMAAQRAAKKYANVDATELYRRALSAAGRMAAEVPATELAAAAEAMGEVADLAGLLEDAWEAYERAQELVGGDPLAMGRLLRKAGNVQMRKGNFDAAIELHTRSLGTLDALPGGETRDRERMETMVECAATANRQGDNEGSIVWAEQVVLMAESIDHEPALAHALNLLETNYTDLNHEDRGMHYERALAIYRDLDDLVGQARVLNNLGYDAFFLGDWEAASDYWRKSEEAAAASGDVLTAAMIANNLAEIEIDRGRLDEAREPLHEALRIWRGARYTLGMAFAHANLGRLESRAGNVAEAEAHLGQAERMFDEVGARLGVLDVRSRQIELELRRGRWAVAIEMLDADLATVVDVPGSTVLQAAQRRLLGYARLQAGDGAGARRAFEGSLELARDASARFEEALTLHAMSQWAAASGVEGPWASDAAEIFSELTVDAPPAIKIVPARNDYAD